MKFLSNNYKNLISIVLCTLLAYSLVTGEILNYISFNDPLGEMGMFFMAGMGVIMSIITLKFK